MKENRQKKRLIPCLCLAASLFMLFFSCSFDYGNKDAAEKNLPDLIMENVDYMRVRGGEPTVRFKAELAERYEDKQLMNLQKLDFEQYEDKGANINAWGSAGNAQVELESGDISLAGNVFVSVDSEDITIQTADLKWKDEERKLSGSLTNAVDINRSDGTSLSGVGFQADVRLRTWKFDSGISGVFVEEEEEIEEEAAGGDAVEFETRGDQTE